MTTKLSLYVCNANTSWIEIAITFSEKSKGDTSLPALFHFTCWPKPSTLPHTAAPAVNWLGAPRCLRQMKRCSEQEDTTSIAKRSTVLGCSISFFSAFGENSFITHLVLSPPKCEHFGIPPCKATMFLTVRIVGSSPTWGKNKKSCRKTGFLFCIIQYLSFVKCAWFQWNAPFRHFWKICFE